MLKVPFPRFTCALLTALSLSQINAQVPRPLRLTLHDAVQLALRQNPEVQIAALNVVEARDNQDVARSALLPQVNGRAAETVQRLSLLAAFGRPVPGFPEHAGPFWWTEAGANGSVPLLDLTAWRRWQQARENVIGYRAQEGTTREQYVDLVVSQYLGGLRAAAAVTAAQSRVDLAKALFDQAADFQKNGVGIRVDTLRANVEYQNERQQLLDAQTQLKTSLYGLARLLNIDPYQTVELTDTSAFFQTPPYSADETIELAWEQRPEMKALAAQIRAAELDKQGVLDSRLPRISLTGAWSEEGLTPTTTMPVYDFAAAVEVPLFTGGRIRAQVAIADVELKKLAQQQTDLRNEIAMQVKTALAQLDSAKAEVDVANEGLDLAQQEVAQARDRFQAGVTNNIEVITAQDELARANDNQIVALYSYNIARADLAHAMGRIEALYGK